MPIFRIKIERKNQHFIHFSQIFCVKVNFRTYFFALFLLFSVFLQLNRKNLAYINIFWQECEILGSKKSKNGGSETPKIPYFIPNYDQNTQC